MRDGLRPSALDRWDEIESRLAGRRPAMFLDYDGTLSPIAPRPELATLSEETRQVLRRLAERFPVVVLSGRGREDVSTMVGLDDLIYAGSHGFDIAGPGIRHEVGEGIPESIERAAGHLREDLASLHGVLIEPKRFSLAVHYRLADEADLPRIESAVDAVLAKHPDLRRSEGKKVFELRPRIDWDKGTALLWLLGGHLGQERSDIPVYPVYIGDDVTDEDAFRAIAGRGIGILVAEEPRPTAADYSLRDPGEVHELLERLAAWG